MVMGFPVWFWLAVLVVVLGCVAVSAFLFQPLPRRRLTAGESPTVLLETLGGGRVGLMNYTFPFVKFTLDDQGVVFRFLASTASLAWGDINRAVLIQPMIPVGQGVEFQVPGNVPLIVWAGADTCRRVLDLCEEHGVTVVRKAAFRI